MLATCRSSRGVFPYAQFGESIAVLKAILLCLEMGLQQVVHGDDALSVVNVINSTDEKWGSDSLIIRDVKTLLKRVSGVLGMFLGT